MHASLAITLYFVTVITQALWSKGILEVLSLKLNTMDSLTANVQEKSLYRPDHETCLVSTKQPQCWTIAETICTQN